MDKFWELFAQSLILQGLLALMFSGVICYLYLTCQPVPQELVALVSLILGYFFGAKNQAAQERLARAIHAARQQEVV
jgi:FtsH-binding integral membrane protein